MAKDGDYACLHVSKIVAELGMGQRTARAHLKTLEIERAGISLISESPRKRSLTLEKVSRY